MSYIEFVDGYAIETTFKDGTTIDAAGDTAYLFGAVSEESDWPSPVYTANFPPTGVNVKEVTAGSSWTSRAYMSGMLGLSMQNGIVIWMAMGKSSTVDAAPLYTHTITPTDDGSQLPSIAWQHEEKGSATNEEYQSQGCKVDSLVLSHDMSGPNLLMAKVEIRGAYALDPGFALTTVPALPATSNNDPYVSLTRTWDYGVGNTALDGLQKVEIVVVNGLEPRYAHSYDTGVYTGDWPYAFGEAPRKGYFINLTMSKNTIERDMWDLMIARNNTKELYFKWTRSANDYIEVTATNCNIVDHPIKTPKVGDVDMVTVILEPEALSFSVKDSIAGGAYGE